MFLRICICLLLVLRVLSQILANPAEGVNEYGRPFPIVYNRQELLQLRPLTSAPPNIDIPIEIQSKQRKRGKKGGIRQRLRCQKFRPPLPSIITGNSQSLRNKMDELKACTDYQYGYRDSCLVCFSETLV